MRKKLVLSLLVFVCLAASAQAAEPFVVLVDEEHGLLLIPEGTAIPRGVEFSLSPRANQPRFRHEANAVAEEGAAPRRFVYAYAAPEKFVEARRRIAEVEAKYPQPAAEELAVDGRPAAGIPAVGAPRLRRIVSNIVDSDETFYYYFWDGSFHAVRRMIYNVSQGVSRKAYGYVYAETGDWDTKVTVNNTSPQVPAWNQSKTCDRYALPFTCTPIYYIYSTYPYYPVVATMTSYGSVARFLYPPCDLPCKSNSSSTISVGFP
ncbi:MAG: hypothetical protein ABI779_08205 [Acidobacteriota bacterium]